MSLLLVNDLLEGRSVVGCEAGLFEGVVIVGGDNGLVEVELEVFQNQSAVRSHSERKSSGLKTIGRQLTN